MINVQDKTISCRDCGREFVFTAGEQEFFAQKGFTNSPVRCPECRAARRASRGDTAGFAVPREHEREREMFPAVCAQCGKDTQVPFQPSQDRAVYCSDCFASQRSAPASYDRQPERSYGQRSGQRRHHEGERYFERRAGSGRRERW